MSLMPSSSLPGIRRGRRAALMAGLALLVVLLFAGYYSRDIVQGVGFKWRFEQLGQNVQGYAEYRHRKTGIVFVRIPAGSFHMGSPPRSPGYVTMEEPRHPVSLSAFLLAKYEVTQAQWLRVMGSNPSKF